VQNLARAFASKLEGDWVPVVGNDGHLLLVDHRKGTIRDPNINLGARGTGSAAGAATQQKMLLAANQVYLALADMERLESADPNAGYIPVKSAAAKGISSLGAFGVKPFAGIADPAAWAALTPNQRQFQLDLARLTGNYPSLMVNFRGSNALLDRLAKEWAAPAGAGDASTRALMRKNRLQLLRIVDQIRNGQSVNFSALPGYKDSVIGAAQDATDLGVPQAQPGEGEQQPSGGVSDFLNPVP
jgi:hypothetical protein